MKKLSKDKQLKLDKAVFKLSNYDNKVKMVLRETKTFKQFMDRYTILNNNFK